MIRIITRNIINIFKKNDSKLMLGRWSLDHTESMIYKKADMTNEDHCGICDNMRLDYIKKEDKTSEKSKSKTINTQ